VGLTVIACGEPARPERAKVRQARLSETGKLSREGGDPQKSNGEDVN